MIIKKLAQTALALQLAFSPYAFAQDDYPNQPIKLIIPFAPGGATDLIGRLVAEHLSQELGQPVIPENRAGAGGSIGAAALTRAPNDGYTLGVATVSTQVVNPIVKVLDYDPHKDLLPIIRVAAVPNVLAVHPSVPADDMGEFITLLKKSPGEYNFASAGMGGVNHIMCEMFMASSNTTMTHIPYKGSGPALTDVLGGQVEAICDQTTSSLSHIQAGSLKAFAVAAPERLDSLPDVPTFEEIGLPDVNSMAWYGIMAPRGTPKRITEKINQAMNAALQKDSLKEALTSSGSIPIGGSSKDFQEVIDNESERVSAVVKTRQIKVE